MKVTLPANFVLGLLAYVRQAALSLDRVEGQYRDLLRTYLCGHLKYSIATVVRRLSNIEGQARKVSIVEALLAGKKIVCLPRDELVSIRNSLLELDELIFGDVDEDQHRRVVVRVALSKSETLLKRRLGRTRSKSVDNVEHFNQTFSTNVSVEDIAGSDWLCD